MYFLDCPCFHCFFFFFFNDTATTEIYTLSLHDALPIFEPLRGITLRERRTHTSHRVWPLPRGEFHVLTVSALQHRSEEHTSELQSRLHLVCRLLLEKKKKKNIAIDVR